MMTADPVATCLAEVKEHARQSDPRTPAGGGYAIRSAQDVPRLVAAVEAVLAVHAPYLLDGLPAHCKHDGFDWPCPTVKAISAALLGEQ